MDSSKVSIVSAITISIALGTAAISLESRVTKLEADAEHVKIAAADSKEYFSEARKEAKEFRTMIHSMQQENQAIFIRLDTTLTNLNHRLDMVEKSK